MHIVRTGILFCLLLLANGTVADESMDADTVASNDDYFVFLYRPGPGWSHELPGLEQPGLSGHFERMQELADAGVLVTGGPFKDLGGALGIFMAPNLEAAQKIVALDPVVANGVMAAEVLPWHPAVTGCVEERAWTPPSSE